MAPRAGLAETRAFAVSETTLQGGGVLGCKGALGRGGKERGRNWPCSSILAGLGALKAARETANMGAFGTR